MTQINYKTAGVDIDAGHQLVENIKKVVKPTFSKNVLTELGGFSALYQIPLQQYQEPVLVASTDGVGTKLKLAIDFNKHDTIGIDLVAMCVNDLVTQNATPLFFLDYYATGKLSVQTATSVIQGIAKGCKEAKISLIGGETAEMPKLYHAKDYDLAGFCVGLIEKKILEEQPEPLAGDVLIAISSSGLHANGYSLVHHLIDNQYLMLDETIDGIAIQDVLLTPTRIYANTLQHLFQLKLIKIAAHITGGGLIENIPRILPSHLKAHLDLKTWSLPTIFQRIKEASQITSFELYRTFNCGAGMICCVSPEKVQETLSELSLLGETGWVIGQVHPTKDSKQRVTFS